MKSSKPLFYSFCLSFFFTFFSFMLAVSDFPNPGLSLLLILVSFVQVGFQLVYFMHIKEDGHELPVFFLFSGLLVGLLTICALLTLI